MGNNHLKWLLQTTYPQLFEVDSNKNMNSNLFAFKAENFAQLHHKKQSFIFIILKYSASKKKSVNLYTRDICGNGYIVLHYLGELLLMLDIDGSKHTKTTVTNRKTTLAQSRIRTVFPTKWLFTQSLLSI